MRAEAEASRWRYKAASRLKGRSSGSFALFLASLMLPLVACVTPMSVSAQTPASPQGTALKPSETAQKEDDLFIIEDSKNPLELEQGKAPPKSATAPPAKKPEIEVDTHGKGIFQIFRLGNEAYEKEEFEEAAAYYSAVVERGIRNGDVYFGLGNSYFRAGDFGRAILNYEKARKLRPRDPDIQHNLDYARTFLIDKEIKPDTLPGSLETLLILHRQTTPNETLWLLAILSACLGALMVLMAMRAAFTEKAIFGYVKGAVWVLFLLQVASAGVKIWVEGNYREGVILADSVKATASPSSSKELLEINSGTKVEILEIRNGYAHIRLPDGVPAFIPEETIGEV
jgi:tetratricopeptide (TPR) repeat protein